MQNDILLQISSRIKEKRKEKHITLQALANEAGVTKGLISQIENNRTVPSLSVLLGIIRALHVDLNDFFDNLGNKESDEPVLVKATALQPFEKEYTKGSYYNRIMSFKSDGKLVDIVLYRQDHNAERGFVSTNAFEYNYMIRGTMKYTIDDKEYILEEGDSFYYDARKPHLSQCLTHDYYTMLVVYFFEEK
ncbi:XRE family transcriptional regulator [Foetidibacter luteolus]|uniref:XRE family transcriptional regulator n=1 Tax=Foetidibacter luteolus TaxID=2608880 RepID=UPI00129A5918|nr:XRE family transcriptional regulator [Foetidibacter luteolus]